MKNVICLFLVAILATSGSAQEQKGVTPQKHHPANKIPEGNWSVNKEIDENGRIVRYDSVYAWSSSGTDLRELNGLSPESIMSEMRARMRSSFATIPSDPFALFFGDTQDEEIQAESHPFGGDFFSGIHKNDFPMLDRMRAHMEDIRRQFFQREEDLWVPAVPESKKRDQKSSLTQRSI